MSSTGDKVLCFLVGVSVGSIAALLYAPKSGRDTRDEISRKANESREYIGRKLDEGRDLVEEGSRRVTSEVTSMVDRGRGEVDQLVEKGRTVIDREKDHLAAAFEAGKEAYLDDKGSSE